MAYTRKPARTEVEPPKGRSVVFYNGAHPWHGRSLPGVADYGDFVPDGRTGYDWERVDPKSKQRYAIVDLPQHLLFFALYTDSEGARPYTVKPTAAHRKAMELLQRAFIVDRVTGDLKPRKDAMQMEADLSQLIVSE